MAMTEKPAVCGVAVTRLHTMIQDVHFAVKRENWNVANGIIDGYMKKYLDDIQEKCECPMPAEFKQELTEKLLDSIEKKDKGMFETQVHMVTHDTLMSLQVCAEEISKLKKFT